MKVILSSLLAVFFLSSCVAYHVGILIPARGILSEETNVQYLESIEGTAQASYFVGLGGLEKSRLIKLAKQDMLANHPLKSNEILFDYSLDAKILWIVPPFYYKKTLFISADVYRIGESTASMNDKSSDRSSPQKAEKKKDVKLAVGDVIYFKEDDRFIRAIVLSYKYPFARLEYKKNDKMSTVEKIIKELYKKEGEAYILMVED